MFGIQGCFLKVAVNFLKNCSKYDSHKTTYEKILLEIFVSETTCIFVWCHSFISSVHNE